MAVFGASYGGISAYIAQELGGSSRLILFPNNGLVGMISDFGLVGVLMMFYSLRQGIGMVCNRGLDTRHEARGMAFVGLANLATPPARSDSLGHDVWRAVVAREEAVGLLVALHLVGNGVELEGAAYAVGDIAQMH